LLHCSAIGLARARNRSLPACPALWSHLHLPQKISSGRKQKWLVSLVGSS
jgi:hypothetical protein